MVRLALALLATASFMAVSHADDQIVPFHIKAGTGDGAWNTPDNPVVVKVGQVLRLYNDDSISHFLHTDGSPCPHGSHPFAPGEYYDCVIQSAHDAGDDDLYDHDQGPDAQFYVQADP
jgi:hypothetical protein